MSKHIWSNEEINILVQNYSISTFHKMKELIPTKTVDQMRWRAVHMGLRKSVTTSSTDLSFLYDVDNPESLYWWGFLMADGHFGEKQLILSVHERDIQHLELFANKCNSKVYCCTKINDWHKEPYTMGRTCITNKPQLSELREKFSIPRQKTYEPPDLSIFYESHRLKYFLIGLIDGDGTIVPNGSIKIRIHKNWYDTMLVLSEKLLNLYDIKSKTILTNSPRVYSLTTLGVKESVKLFNILEKDIPLMQRKWSKFLS